MCEGDVLMHRDNTASDLRSQRRRQSQSLKRSHGVAMSVVRSPSCGRTEDAAGNGDAARIEGAAGIEILMQVAQHHVNTVSHTHAAWRAIDTPPEQPERPHQWVRLPRMYDLSG